ncbi:MAG TPA: methylmalonyl Co-A mutase-associated GTPase MeaB [Gemmatimonadaceae bacterium]|nr:methylmalonyl Co-A mutase-associated GTPase MeaB [Gemmatimonadaceae bacterium]
MTISTSPAALSAAHERLLADFAAGKPAALARVVSIVENRRAGFEAILATLHPRVGRAWRVGLTGPPGAGKSTLTMRLTSAYREAGKRVGVVAVDPTSPFTGGALLGDRIRMESVALDPGVFIRSMATRGSLGGLAAATREVADVLDAFGIDVILIETVGVGQTELDIARTADTSVVVLVPESGDSIQTLKAGLMEIADIYVVNKADRPGADRLRNELELMLGLRGGSSLRDVPAHHGVDLRSIATAEEKRALNPARAAREAARKDDASHWTPPVLRTVAAQGEGVTELLDAVARHMAFLERSGELRERRARRLRERVVEVAERLMRGRLWSDEATRRALAESLPRLERGETTPFAVAEALLTAASAVVAGNSAR